MRPLRHGMTAALTVMFLASAAGLLTGVALSKRLRARRRYFEELVSLINALIGDVRFRRTNIESLLESFGAVATKRTVDEFVAYVRGEKEKLVLTRGVLTAREHRFVTELFSALGTFDADTQVFMLDGFGTKAAEFYEEAKEREKKYAGAYVRLGLLFGLAAGIIMA